MAQCVADAPYARPDVLKQWRDALLRELTTPPRRGGGGGGGEPTDPLEAYELLFARAPDAYVQSLVRATMARRRATPRRRGGGAPSVRERRAGFVYVFWDSRDPSSLLKIGATTLRTPEHRIAQWRRELGARDEQASVTLLFAFGTRAPFLAEQLVHETLSCWHVPLRVNRLTNRRLTEYYRVRDVRALRHFVHAVCRYADYLHRLDDGGVPPPYPPA